LIIIVRNQILKMKNFSKSELADYEPISSLKADINSNKFQYFVALLMLIRI
jgi:hypothetical protein